MFTYRVMWNDAAKRRDVEVRVAYAAEGEVIRVLDVVPSNVLLYEVDGESVFKEMPVHTATGRRVLARAFLAGRDQSVTLEEEILAYHASTDDRLPV